MKHTRIIELLNSIAFDTNVVVKGWVRTKRGNKQVAFIAVNDGSVIHSIQLVADVSKFDEELLKKVTTGACIIAKGKLVKSQGQGQTVEVQAESIEVVGEADETFPLQKKGHTLEFLREIAHLRPRTNTFGAVFRIRHHMAFAIHKYFNDRGFFYLHSPVITGSDAEGAGEMFRVTTLNLTDLPILSKSLNKLKKSYVKAVNGILLDRQINLDNFNIALKNCSEFKKIEDVLIADKKKIIKNFNDIEESSKLSSFMTFSNTIFSDTFITRAKNEIIYGGKFNLNKKLLTIAEDFQVSTIQTEIDSKKNESDLSFEKLKTKLNFLHLCISNNIYFNKLKVESTKNKKINFKEDFFGNTTNLTVSGQLEGELSAMALGNVYTFGPTFRAENSNTPRHLAEFWMIEPEMAFYDIQDNMDLAESFLKYLIQYALDNCMDDLEFLNTQYDKELINRLRSVLAEPFERLTYTKAVDVLMNSGKKFEFKVEWGTDLQKEHENYLVEHFKRPVILTDYPKVIKAFYMKQNDDGKTVRAMDILFPWIGEIIGGSQREENYEKLVTRMREMHIPEKEMWWYLDTRRYGACEHAGFGLGFERLILFITGLTNIRDVIPFPRTPGNAEF